MLILSISLPAYAITYNYDRSGRLTSVSYDFGLKVNLSYDPGTSRVTVPPYVYGAEPVNGAVYVPVDQNVYVTFSEEVEPGTDYAGIALKTNGTVVTTTYSLNSPLLTINPVENLDYSTTYAVYIPAGAVKDLSGNNLTNDYVLTFATESLLSVVYTDPVDGAADVSVDKTVYLAFNKDIQPGPDSGGIALKAGETVVTTTYSVYGSVLTIDPADNLNYSAAYAVYIPAGAVQDLAGKGLGSAYSFSFATAADTTAPTVTATPPGGSYNAAQSVTLAASEPAVIYYTTDGTDPTASSTEYAAPIAITADTTLKFMAVDQPGNQSVIYTETYIIDTTAPTVAGSDPAEAATGVPVDKTVYVTFSENVQPGANYGGIMLRSGETVVTVTYSINGQVLTIDPAQNLNSGTAYAVYVPGGSVRDMAGNSLASDFTLNFTTEADAAPPTVTATDPAANATGVPSDKTICVTFSENIQPGTSYDNIKITYGNNKTVSATKGINGNILTIDPVANLSYKTTYTVTVPAGAVKDMAGNALAADYTFSFTTRTR
ncbi:MAG: Ig-like domain-containing protein [Bacillota bacterium]